MDLLTRLNRSIIRLNKFYELNAPSIIKQAELLIITDICDKLLITLNLKGEN